MIRIWLIVAAANGFIAVAAGAFAAHGLKDHLPPADLAIFETAARYQMYHALALIGVAWLCAQTASRPARLAGWAFTFGIVVFSGSLYLLVLTDTRWLGAITPIGGTAFLIGWLAVLFAAWKMKRD